MSKKTIIPVLSNREAETKKESACTSCGAGGCCGGFGIKAGSEKDVVFRNIFVYMTMGILMFTVAYLIMRFMTWING
ncbi:hypothetical protein RE476_08970 [Methanolobus mangrovi]|uniref:Uncharacterized protein n=1 Tax=Methanolobus mangrovi TaxID=3072977 RepID=A0AA51UEK2_9EURY|nr:hypothetical protein [Methanolobus mangrovi]WMW21519.1 hypothetical protein RE476_08970 [Methanolobus mangrovi]